MTWTIIGLVIATAVSIEGTIASQRGQWLKLFLIGLALASSAVAGISAYKDDAGKVIIQNDLDSATRQLAAQRPILDLVNATVGDLGTLNRLSAGKKYYVRISAGSQPDMEKYLDGIEKKFRGARSSGLISVRKLRSDCPPNDPRVSCWGLVFGSNLSPAAAEVFERFADENGFPPPNQHASIKLESRN